MIVYVDEYGEAHTVDQAHKLALQINALINSGLGAKVQAFINSLTKVIGDIAEAFKEIWYKIKGWASDFAEALRQPGKENYRQQMQRQHKRKNHSIFRMYIKNKFDGKRPTDHARFHGSRRKG